MNGQRNSDATSDATLNTQRRFALATFDATPGATRHATRWHFPAATFDATSGATLHATRMRSFRQHLLQHSRNAKTLPLQGVTRALSKGAFLILIEQRAVSFPAPVHPASFLTAWRLFRGGWFVRWFGLRCARHIGRPIQCPAIASPNERRGR